jgi:hypothetical protein
MQCNAMQCQATQAAENLRASVAKLFGVFLFSYLRAGIHDD